VTWLLGYRTGMGARGGWWGLTLEIAVSAAILWWRLARGGWQPAAQAARARLRPPAESGAAAREGPLADSAKAVA